MAGSSGGGAVRSTLGAWGSIYLGLTMLAGCLGGAPQVQAQIVRDGTVGPAGPLAGPDYTISHTDGTRAGSNLFHSFSAFNIGTGERATFTGPGDITNVISRVTGGTPSQIDGTLRSQVGRANVWFLNPAGVAFGPNARIDVPAALHVSTADEVRLADGTRFRASERTASGLSAAAPEAFGFLGRTRPAAITVNGSRLEAGDGQALSLVGGDLQMTGGRIASAGGQVTLVATAGPGTVRAADGTSSAPARGAVQLAQSAEVDSSSPGGGRVTIRGGRVDVTEYSQLNAQNTGARDATGGVTIEADTVRLSNSRITTATLGSGHAGSVTVRGKLEVSGESSINASTLGQGNGGAVSLTGPDIRVLSGGEISTATSGPGKAGKVTIQADQLLEVSGRGGSDPSRITSSAESGASGNAGSVNLTGRNIQVRNGGAISSFAVTGQPGEVTLWVPADGVIQLAGNATIRTDGPGGGRVTIRGGQIDVTDFSQLNAPNTGARDATDGVTIEADTVRLSSNSRITTATGGSGHAGPVTVRGKLEVSGESSITASTDRGSSGSGGTVSLTGPDIRVLSGGEISTATSGPGKAGEVTITADRLEVSDRGRSNPSRITSSAETGASGDAGEIDIKADNDIELNNGASITTESIQGGGGRIKLTVGRLVHLTDSEITSSTRGESATKNAGDITIDTIRPRFLVLNRSTIRANAKAGTGGNIRIDAGFIFRSAGSRIEASSERGLNGRIDISGPDENIAGSLTALPIKFLEATALLPTACGARLGASANSLVTSGLSGLPADPDRLLLLPSYLSYTGHRPPDDLGPAPGTADHAVPSGRLPALSVGAGRLSFACGV